MKQLDAYFPVYIDREYQAIVENIQDVSSARIHCLNPFSLHSFSEILFTARYLRESMQEYEL